MIEKKVLKKLISCKVKKSNNLLIQNNGENYLQFDRIELKNDKSSLKIIFYYKNEPVISKTVGGLNFKHDDILNLNGVLGLVKIDLSSV